MTPGEIKAQVIHRLNKNSAAINALLDPPFEFAEVFDVITEAIELVEEVSPDDITGPQKRAIVTGVIEWLDNKFSVTATIIGLILPKLPRWLRWLLPIKRIKKIVVKIFPAMIDVIVRILNKYVWKKEAD